MHREDRALYDGITQLSSADQPKFPRAAAFARYCFGLDLQGQVPVSRLDLKDIPKLAPYMAIAGVIDGGKDFVVRLVGTKLANEFLGRDPTGLKTSESLPDDEYGKRALHVMREAVRTKRPVLNQPGRTRLRDKSYYRLETVTFPIVDDGGVVVKIVSFYDFVLEPESTTDD